MSKLDFIGATLAMIGLLLSLYELTRWLFIVNRNVFIGVSLLIIGLILIGWSERRK